MTINTTYDIFWLLFGFSILLLTIFACWGMYYFIMIVRDTREIIKNVKKKLELIDEFIVLVKEKIEDTSGYIKTIVDMALKVIGWVQSQKEPEEEKTSVRKRKLLKK